MPLSSRGTRTGLRLALGPGLQGPLTHWHFDTFEVRWDARWRGEALVTFQLDPLGRASTLAIGETRFRRLGEESD